MKNILVLLFSVSIIPLWSQTIDDVELFNTRGLHGTPRFVGMGGAFTALGNDLSSIHLNPAGASVFRSDNIGITLGMQTTRSTQYFMDGNSYQSNFDLLIENIGLVKKFEVGGYGNETKLAFSIGYNKLADFNRSYSVTGRNLIGPIGQGSLADYWLIRELPNGNIDGAIGLHPDDLASFGLFEELAAYQANLLYAPDDTIRDVTFGNGVSNEYADVRYRVDERGSRNEASLSFGGEYNDNFYYGVSLGFPTLSYRKEDFVSELNLPNDTFPYDATSYTLRRLNEIYATGINIKLGLIYRPARWIRFGAAYESPSWYTVSQIYEFDVTANFSNGDRSTSDIFSSGDYTYKLKTPAIYRVGAAIVIRDKALFSVDYEYTNPSQTTTYMGGSGSNNTSEADLNNANADILAFMQNTNTFKLGAEYRLGLVSMRAGYNFRESMYRNPEGFKSNINTFSAGLGYQTRSFGIDVTYSNSQYNRNDFVHPYLQSGDANDELVDSDATLSNILLGVTFRF